MSAAAAVDSADLVAGVPREPAAPVPRLVLVPPQVQVPADLVLLAQRPPRAAAPVLGQVPPPEPGVLQVPVVLAQVVLEQAVPLQRPLSRRSLSAAKASNSPSPGRP